MTGRPPKVPRETLEPLLTQLRGEGSTAKAIARGLGYSVDHVFKLCAKWGIKKQLKPIKTVDAAISENLQSHAEGASQLDNPPAAPDSALGDTR